MDFVSSNFLLLQRFSFSIFSLISTCLMVTASNIPKYLLVSFSPSVLMTTWFSSSTPSVRWCRLPLFITSMAHFSMPNSIPISWLYILTVCNRVSKYFSFLVKQFDVVRVHQVVDFFFLRFIEFVSSCAFPKDVVEWRHSYHKWSWW